jgi:hypothetical protein
MARPHRVGGPSASSFCLVARGLTGHFARDPIQPSSWPKRDGCVCRSTQSPGAVSLCAHEPSCTREPPRDSKCAPVRPGAARSARRSSSRHPAATAASPSAAAEPPRACDMPYAVRATGASRQPNAPQRTVEGPVASRGPRRPASRGGCRRRGSCAPSGATGSLGSCGAGRPRPPDVPRRGPRRASPGLGAPRRLVSLLRVSCAHAVSPPVSCRPAAACSSARACAVRARAGRSAAHGPAGPGSVARASAGQECLGSRAAGSFGPRAAGSWGLCPAASRGTRASRSRGTCGGDAAGDAVVPRTVDFSEPRVRVPPASGRDGWTSGAAWAFVGAGTVSPRGLRPDRCQRSTTPRGHCPRCSVLPQKGAGAPRRRAGERAGGRVAPLPRGRVPRGPRGRVLTVVRGCAACLYGGCARHLYVPPGIAINGCLVHAPWNAASRASKLGRRGVPPYPWGKGLGKMIPGHSTARPLIVVPSQEDLFRRDIHGRSRNPRTR